MYNSQILGSTGEVSVAGFEAVMCLKKLNLKCASSLLFILVLFSEVLCDAFSLWWLVTPLPARKEELSVLKTAAEIGRC